MKETPKKPGIRAQYFLELENGRDLPFDYKPDRVHMEVRQLPNGYVVVAWLQRDEHCDSPLHPNQDGMGMIYTSHKNAGREEHRKMQEVLGLNEYWDKDLSEFEYTAKNQLKAEWQEAHPGEDGDDVYLAIDGYHKDWQEKIDAAAEKLWSEARNPHVVKLDCYSHGGECWAVSGSARARNFPDQQWDVGHGAGVWVPDQCCVDHIRYTAVKNVLGNKTQVEWRTTECSHDGRSIKQSPHYILPDGTVKCGFKTFHEAILAAAAAQGLALAKAAINAAEREEAVVCASQACEEYNKWLEGDCWGVRAAVFNPENKQVEEDACWGYIGHEYATKERDDWLKHYAEKYEKQENRNGGCGSAAPHENAG